MHHLRRLFTVLSTLLLSGILAQAQIAYTGGTYTQNFDTLPTSAGTTTVLPNTNGNGPFALDAAPISATGLAGWSLAKYSGTGAGAVFIANNGSSNQGAGFSYGAASATERALGSLASGTVISRFGVAFTNSTASTITEFTLAYTGEQWRRGGGAVDVLAFEYAVGATNINTGSFVGVPALGFTAPITGAGDAALVGNDAANKVALAATVTGLSWAPGQTLVLRWSDANDAGNDDGLAIDDLTFSTNAGGGPVPPSVTATVPADAAANIASNASVVITFNAPALVTGNWFTLTGSLSGPHTAAVLGGPTAFTLVPSPAFSEGETVTVTVHAAQVTDAATNSAAMAADYSFAFTIESLAPLPIHTIQGSGTTSAYAGQKVSVEGIVTATFQGNPGLSGFYLQAAEADYDANPATSEGLFIFNTSFPVSVGQAVRVTGTVTEFGTAPSTQTELTGVTAVTVLSTGNPLPAAVSVSLPFASTTAAEACEGMRVVLPQTLTVTDNSDLGHFGEVFLSNGRLPSPTNVVAPGAPAIAQAAANFLNKIMLDDGISTAYPSPTPFLADSAGLGETRRAGSTATGVTGILDEKFGSYVIEPTTAVTFVDANPRSAPPAVGGTLKVAIGNVLNLFNGNGAGGGFPTSRGADTLAEFQRQRAKIIAGIIALAPDIMGLTEVENDGYGATSALADLVNGLNAAAPAGTTYAFVDASAVDIVSDEIHCAFIYRVETVALVGAPAMLNHPSFNGYARNPLAQTFRQIANGEKLTVCINHFKSKGSASSGAAATGGLSPNPNLDQGDGQGMSNYIRTLQANALTAWLATDPTGSGDPDILIIGDLNAYAKEDPIVAIENAGYINLTETFEGVGGYSYAFDGAFGHLDHALASDHLTDQVTGAATWHANSDEPVYYDYNVENKNAAQQAVNVGTPYRYSDHDPVVVGLNLQPDPAPDVTAKLTITRSAPRQNPITKRYMQAVTVKNISGQPITGPMSVVLTQLSPNATLNNPAGYTTVVTPAGSPWFNISVGADGILSANETAVATIEFLNPTNQPITWTPKVVSGPGGR